MSVTCDFYLRLRLDTHLNAFYHKSIYLRVVDQEGSPVSPLVLHEGLQVCAERLGRRGLRPCRGLFTTLQ